MTASLKMHLAKLALAPVLLCAALAPATAADARQGALASAQPGAAIAGADAGDQTGGTAAPADRPAAVEQAMRDLARRADDAWNRRDANAMAAFYAPEASSTIGAQQLAGRGQMLAYFTSSFARLPPGLTHRTVLRRIEPIGAMYATDNDVFLEAPDEHGGKRVVRQFFTFTMVRPGRDGWEIVAVRAIPLAAP